GESATVRSGPELKPLLSSGYVEAGDRRVLGGDRVPQLASCGPYELALQGDGGLQAQRYGMFPAGQLPVTTFCCATADPAPLAADAPGFFRVSSLPGGARCRYTTVSPVGHPAGCRCSGPSNAIASRQHLGRRGDLTP